MLLTQTDELLLHLSLNRITFLRFEEKKNLLKNLDSSHSLALLSIEEIEKIVGRNFYKSVNWNGLENLKMAQAALYYCRLLNIKILLNEEEYFPELLRQISQPPYLLFCRGNEKILCEPSVSVVGTRRLSQSGKNAARQFAYEAVKDGLNIVSGLANGADGFAHQGALDAYYERAYEKGDLSRLGKNIAVIPSGIDQVVPASHARMAGQILKSGGCIVSEYEPKMEMANWHFVGRNRIIAGLSPATVVIEAPCGSGALITADFALEFNRDVMFHKVGFEETAQKIACQVQNQVEADFAAGRVSKYKVSNTAAKFLEAGAAVINDYSDYCRVFSSAPGLQNNQYIQGELFQI